MTSKRPSESTMNDVSNFVRERIEGAIFSPTARAGVEEDWMACHEQIDVTMWHGERREYLPGKVADPARLVRMAKQWRSHPNYPLTAIETLDEWLDDQPQEKKVPMYTEISASIPEEPKVGTVIMEKDGVVWRRHAEHWYSTNNPATFDARADLWPRILSRGPILLLTNEETDAWLTS